jgi:hypothetical protein
MRDAGHGRHDQKAQFRRTNPIRYSYKADYAKRIKVFDGNEFHGSRTLLDKAIADRIGSIYRLQYSEIDEH